VIAAAVRNSITNRVSILNCLFAFLILEGCIL
jgi:hypothetical protein